jgi:hypothetical protein
MSETSKGKASIKRLGIIGGAALVLGLLQYQFNIIPLRPTQQAAVPAAVELPTAELTQAEKVAEIALPTAKPSTARGTPVRINVWAWTAQHGPSTPTVGPRP